MLCVFFCLFVLGCLSKSLQAVSPETAIQRPNNKPTNKQQTSKHTNKPTHLANTQHNKPKQSCKQKPSDQQTRKQRPHDRIRSIAWLTQG